MRVAKRSLCFLLWLILLLAVQAAEAQEICYAYDLLGRLIAVVDQQGRTAIYDYDAVGNILAIRRNDATGRVGITFINPEGATVGTEVEILGTGFSEIASENQVGLGGVAAPVVSANNCRLTIQVLESAMGGPITVTTPLGSAISDASLVVINTTIPDTLQVQLIGTSRQFTAPTFSGIDDQRVVWSVNGIMGGNATVGTITAGGLYTAPATVPTPPTVTIRATSVPLPQVFVEESVTILGEPTGLPRAAVSVRFGPPPLGTISAAPVSVSNPPVVLIAGTTRQFTATIPGTDDQRVIWSVNGIDGGNATVGTIAPTGLYTAPVTVPTPPTVTIRATSVPFPALFVEETIIITAGPTGLPRAAVSVRFGPPPLGTVSAAPVSVGFGLPPAFVFAEDVSVANAPVITAISPASGAQGATVALTLTGVNFTGATALTFVRNGLADAAISAADLVVNAAGDRITATLTIGAAAAIGPRIVIVTTPAGKSTGADIGGNIFSVRAP